MSKFKLLFAAAVIMFCFAAKSNSYAQNGPVMYFCESYGSGGEIGISDRFTTGFLTVMVKCDYALGLKNTHIQFDKYSTSSGKFEYNKKFPYTVDPTMKYIYFSGDDLSFSSPGVYRVFLLDDNDHTVASALIEIIRK